MKFDELGMGAYITDGRRIVHIDSEYWRFLCDVGLCFFGHSIDNSDVSTIGFTASSDMSRWRLLTDEEACPFRLME